MGRTLSRQVRICPPTSGGTDPEIDNGAPYHAMLGFDTPQNLNNMAAYCDPTFQFALAARTYGNYVAAATRWVRASTAIPASGMAFLCQMPILLPHQATRLLWTLDVMLGSVTGPEPAATVTVTAINLFLSTNPLTSLIASQQAVYPNAFIGQTSNELSGNFSADSISHAVTRTLTVSFPGAPTSSPAHYLADDTSVGWVGFNSDQAIMHNNDGYGPLAWLIVGATYNSAAVFDYIEAHEFSIWGAYE
jgi:hypothetical protein